MSSDAAPIDSDRGSALADLDAALRALAPAFGAADAGGGLVTLHGTLSGALVASEAVYAALGLPVPAAHAEALFAFGETGVRVHASVCDPAADTVQVLVSHTDADYLAILLPPAP